jgi:hypothetical protein
MLPLNKTRKNKIKHSELKGKLSADYVPCDVCAF